MKHLASLFMLGLALTMSALEFSVDRIKPYPKQNDGFWQAPLYRCDNPKIKTTLYGFLTFAPGTSRIDIRLTYRAGKETNVSCGLNFRTAEQGNAGRSPRTPLKPCEDFQTADLTFDVPVQASSAQFVLSVKGSPAELELRSLTWDTVSDRAELRQASVSDKPSSWEISAELRNFYIASGGGSAAVQTRVRLAYDDKNLYVGFLADEPNMADVKETITQRDGPVWRDDCVELFLFDRNRNSGWQFVVNPLGIQYDSELRQAQEGDPYKAAPWNGEWTAQVWKNDASWEASFVIPWSTLNYDKAPPELYMNFARERTGNREQSHWNAFTGKFQTAPKYARAVFGPQGEIIRYRKLEAESYQPKRDRVCGRELLSDEPGNYIVGSWGHGYYANTYPAELRKSFTPEKQKAFFEKMAKHGLFGPAFPWSASRGGVYGGLAELKRINREFGMKYPYAIFGSNVFSKAVKKYHAPLFTSRNRVDPASEEYLKAVLDTIAEMRKFLSVPGNRELVRFVHGIDEPTNIMPVLYDVKSNPELKEPLAEFDRKVKEETGFGKYGYYDWSSTPDEQTPFRKLAMFRYWNRHFANYLKTTAEAIRAIDPDLPYMAVNANACSGVSVMDYAMLSPYAEYFSCDPYPTSAQNFFGMARAMYHTGFSVRMVHDLACKSRTCVMPQGFIYHGGRPSPADLREWASQAMKNGAEFFYWYAFGPACVTMPDGFEEMLKLCDEIRSMKKLILPKETRTAILYSDADRMALDDKASHAAYTVYSVLGEHVKANFRFVSPTGLATGIHSLTDIRVLYVPRMSYTDPESTARLLDFVKQGGTMVVFDPEIWSFNLDGSIVPEREIITGKLTPRITASAPLKYGKLELSVSAAANISRDPGKIMAYDVADGAEKVLAVYPDGKPAAVEKNLEKGKIIFFAVQPFGNSDAALNPEGWRDFFTDICREYGEKTDLPIWDFVLPGK